ncbi:hypothetical protein [Streptomyces regalis]|uniref:Uncharacterized protein n=1 Tax=Streptomyces regalis TaxID=68262 RepID=A0A0X3VK09_9ACTN|nr:hypothetical protein [Streptomyces regalis]KUL45123.1 hypothetical protein ADL12_04235 [Streptomyces regalis]
MSEQGARLGDDAQASWADGPLCSVDIKTTGGDPFWLTCLRTAILLGMTLARLLHARAAYRRVTTGTDGTDAPTTERDCEPRGH